MDEKPAANHQTGIAYFQKLADGAPIMIWMSGQDMGCFYFNRAWLDFVGRTLEQESGNGWAEGVHSADLERCVNHYIACFQKRVPFAMTYRLRHHTGEHRWILDRGAPHFGPSGEFLGYNGGCAELAASDAVIQHTALGEGLQKIRDFGLSVAENQTPADATSLRVEPLDLVARRLAAAHAAESPEINHAAKNLKKLARDLLVFGQIERGACLTDNRPDGN
ncbi:MAG TPA: PAS domain-containing protein [Opitutaceae bacterium]|jgi:PAS domain S-box-containing protein